MVVGAAAAASADAQLRFVVEGRGFGHGVGLSQYGARGAALKGWDHPRILGWYYRGSQLQTMPATPVRVLVTDAQSQLRFVLAGGGAAIDPSGVRVELVAGTTYRAQPTASGMNLLAPNDTVVATGPVVLRIVPTTSPGLTLDGRRFRGEIEVRNDRGALDAINVLDLEDYLPGVLPGEMPSSWGNDTPAALRAQAVAARSYALAQRRTGSSFDLYADTRSQVYGGLDSEDSRATAAVRATAGQVLMCNGQLLTTYFFSTSGGQTENVENVFGGSPQSCLVGVPDPFDDVSPLHVWPDPATYTPEDLGRRLGLGGAVAKAEVARQGVSPRVITLRVTTVDGVPHDLPGASVRRALGLRDTWFVVRGEGPAPVPTAPTPTVGAGQPKPAPKNLMVVASRQLKKTRAIVIARRLSRARPEVSVLRRADAYLVVSNRFALMKAAAKERIALKRFGYRAVVTRVRRSDRPVRTPVVLTPRPAPTPAPTAPAPVPAPAPQAAATFTVIAGEHERLTDAQAAAVRLTRKGHRATVITHSVAGGATTYRVVTLRDVSRARAREERSALAALGMRARLERSGAT